MCVKERKLTRNNEIALEKEINIWKKISVTIAIIKFVIIYEEYIIYECEPRQNLNVSCILKLKYLKNINY